MKSYLRNMVAGFVAVVLCMVGLGLVYPASVWAVSRLTAERAEGHVVYDGDCAVASRLLADGREGAGWFVGRAPGMTNLGPAAPELTESIGKLKQEIAQREGVAEADVPADAVTGSGSGVDSDISPEYAQLQVPRVARERGMTPDEVAELVAQATVPRGLGVLGEEVVNVSRLNLSLPGGERCN
ncbi:potassium-transporting ATPase subunit C [Corynebacterium epidermidicanis]|uniref:K+-transporting ATPase, c chain n=1 Tax=Corynebacterium epidermidicanis TaxID=1050174 RepID=A0A0G3GL07_9CORY|nr:potassium-transporting ATPase subunit C [Corynebacterium epidermidicanis]AKK01926.1 K+-transporting ATPase, c chain [Corynebacterium epidermidicanis]